MSHGSGRLDRRLCAAAEGITEHTLEGNDFWVHNKEVKEHVWNNWEKSSVQASSLSCCLKCHPPDSSLPSMWYTSDGKVQLVKFNPPSLPSVQGYWFACWTRIQTHTRIHTCNVHKCAHTQTRRFHFKPTHPFLFQNISCFHATTYASWMLASDIQISSAAKCATNGLSSPILGGCTTLFSETSSQPMPGRQLRDKTIHYY